MELEVRHLRVLCAIADAGSLRRASAPLRMTQPALTAQLQRIERMLGGQLFRRGQDGTVLTPLGEHVVSRGRALLTAFDDLQHDVIVKSQRNGQLSVRIGTMEGPLLAGLVSRLGQALPRTDLTAFAQTGSPPLADLAADGRLDLAIVGDCPGYELVPGAGVVAHFVVTEPVFALLPAGHRLASQREIELADLAEEKWILSLGDADRCWEYYYATFESAGIEPRVQHRVGGAMLKDLVRAGQGVSLSQATSPGGCGLAIRPIIGTPLWYRHCVLWRRDHPIADHHRLLTRLLADAYTASAETSVTYQQWLTSRRLTIADLIAAEFSEPFGIVHGNG